MAAFEHHVGRHRAAPSTFLAWLWHVKLTYLIGMLVLIMITVPLITHYYISNIHVSSSDAEDTFRSRTKLDHTEDLTSVKASDLKFRIEELRRIKASVNNELRELESKRQKLHSELTTFNTQIDTLKGEAEGKQMELEQLRVTIQHQRLEREELAKDHTPDIQAPYRILPSTGDSVYVPPPHSHYHCRMHNCFDYSRCSLTSKFPVYLYSSDDYQLTSTSLDSFIKLSVMHAFDSSPHLTLDPNIACVYIVLLGDIEGGLYNTTDLEARLHRLPFWHGDGRNHLLLTLARDYRTRDVLDGVNIGRAMIAQPAFTQTQLRCGFDIVMPPSLGVSHGEVWHNLPPILPARRKYLLSFQGENRYFGRVSPSSPGSKEANIHPELRLLGKNNHLIKHDSSESAGKLKFKSVANTDKTQISSEITDLINFENSVVETLKSMQSHGMDVFRFEFKCQNGDVMGVRGEWGLCQTDSDRHDMLKLSTFTLIIAPMNTSIISTTLTQVRIYEALKYGAIPVVLGDYLQFPFQERLQWKQAAIFVPKARISELHFLLRTYQDADLVEMRRQGRILWEAYLGSSKHIVDMLLSSVRTRLGIPPFPVRDEPSPSVFGGDFQPLKEDFAEPQPEMEEILGPIEPPYASPRFKRNFTMSTESFSVPGDPFHLYPYTPFQPILPGEAKFTGSGLGFRPIGDGAGGAGKEFNGALGGNMPREQFTIVILTYERETVLLNALSRFRGLPHLNKVIVVWNSPRPPAEDLRWPDIGVEIHVVKTSRNSLNNRFLPYDVIETEAILSIDDDAHLRHDEIMFGFRVWRESRDRIVGFPGRFHAWDLSHNNWLYNSNYSCELSMVLTGAAFFHKYYAYLYSYIQPQAIRDKVDEYLNCEDIAMNFLVSHITRKPPIKVTSRWTFRCAGCPKALSVEEEHFHERHHCINYFTKVYGYMPLLYTQFRADSVLFKTRIPHDKQKCFKYV